MNMLTNLTMTSFKIEATSSRSYSQTIPIEPKDTFTAFTFFGTRFDNGEILNSFWGNWNFPEAIKSICGMKVNIFLSFSA